MENVHSQPGGSLNMAVDRLDRALDALESRVRALQAGEPIPEYTGGGAAGTMDSGGLAEDYDRVLAELEEARASNAQLAEAASAAHQALGLAAANIRQLLANEAA